MVDRNDSDLLTHLTPSFEVVGSSFHRYANLHSVRVSYDQLRFNSLSLLKRVSMTLHRHYLGSLVKYRCFVHVLSFFYHLLIRNLYRLFISSSEWRLWCILLVISYLLSHIVCIYIHIFIYFFFSLDATWTDVECSLAWPLSQKPSI